MLQTSQLRERTRIIRLVHYCFCVRVRALVCHKEEISSPTRCREATVEKKKRYLKLKSFLIILTKKERPCEHNPFVCLHPAVADTTLILLFRVRQLTPPPAAPASSSLELLFGPGTLASSCRHHLTTPCPTVTSLPHSCSEFSRGLVYCFSQRRPPVSCNF